MLVVGSDSVLITFDTGSNGFILSRGKNNLSGTELSTSLGKLIAQYRDVLLVAHKIPWCIINVDMAFSSIFGNVSFECGHSGADSFCKISYARVRERLELFGFDFVIRNIDDTLMGTFTAIDVCKILETIQYIRDRFLSGGFSFNVVIRGIGSDSPIDYFECCSSELLSLIYDRRNSGNITTVLSDGSTVGVYSTSIAGDYITFKFLIQVSSSMYKVMGSSFFDVNKFFSVVERSVFEFGEFVGCHR